VDNSSITPLMARVDMNLDSNVRKKRSLMRKRIYKRQYYNSSSGATGNRQPIRKTQPPTPAIPISHDSDNQHIEQLCHKLDKLVYQFATFSCQICDKLIYHSLSKLVKIGPVLMQEFRNINRELLPHSIVRTCSRCAGIMAKGKVPSQSLMKNLTLPPIPKSISDLTTTELRLISQVRPYLKIYLLNKGRSQRASKGLAVHFPMQIDEIVKSLPLVPENSDFVVVREAIGSEGISNDLKIRPSFVLAALAWLKCNNPFYRDVSVNENLIQSGVGAPIIQPDNNHAEFECDQPIAQIGYNAISENRHILRASMCQSHVIFGVSGGNQCTAMCAAFLARCYVDAPNTWTRPVMDEVLIQGDQLYKQRRPFCAHNLLAVDEVVGELCVLNTLSVILTTAPFEQLLELQGRMRRNCAAKDLKIKISHLFDLQHTEAIITVNEYSMALHVHNDFVYLFDSHARGPNGARASDRHGLAFVMKIPFLIAEDKISSLVTNNCLVTHLNSDVPFIINPLLISDARAEISYDNERTSTDISPIVSPARKSSRCEVESSEEEPDDEVNVAGMFREFGARNELDCVISNDDFIEPHLSEVLRPANYNSPFVLDREKNPPLNDRTKFLDVLAFPYLFPNGTNGIDKFRKIQITPLDYFQQRIMSNDPRFKGVSEFLFYALSVIDKWKIKQSVAVIGSLRTQANCENNEELLQQIGVDNPQIIMRNIRGSSSYRKKYGSDLIAMIKQLGIPTFFFTFSYDDLNSVECMRCGNGTNAQMSPMLFQKM
jgi:hypothetical protein